MLVRPFKKESYRHIYLNLVPSIKSFNAGLMCSRLRCNEASVRPLTQQLRYAANQAHNFAVKLGMINALPRYKTLEK